MESQIFVQWNRTHYPEIRVLELSLDSMVIRLARHYVISYLLRQLNVVAESPSSQLSYRNSQRRKLAINRPKRAVTFPRREAASFGFGYLSCRDAPLYS